ncbi:MAG: histone deacetylase [Chloroflexota bacterium]|nr:histone deacetylase [Chloroflexota bacterium]
MPELVYFYPNGHEAHEERGHPERPERVEAMLRALQQIGWWDDFPHLEPDDVPKGVLETIHNPGYLTKLQLACSRGQRIDLDTYVTTASWELALKAAGGAIAVSRAVWGGEARRGFALTRPPGHHATSKRAMGFCLLNNIAIAAEYLLQHEGAERVAIVDLDQHHGNGTQAAFWTRGDVFYISTHQYPHYPGTGRVHETGEGKGEGLTANFPLPPFSGDRAFQVIMEDAIVPLLDRFAPEMILVSYGFDTHWRDPLGSLLLTAAGYKHLIESLTGWADRHCEGRIALFLEGGYDLDAAAACTQGVVAALLGREWDDPLGSPHQAATESWHSMLQDAKQVWGL